MRIIDTVIEPAEPGIVRVITTIDLSTEPEGFANETIGEGPTGNAVPDKIVRFLIENGGGSVSLSEIKRAVGGHPGTVSRQAWTLATNAPDLQHRLRGWVTSAERGRYSLTPDAITAVGRQDPTP